MSYKYGATSPWEPRSPQHEAQRNTHEVETHETNKDIIKDIHEENNKMKSIGKE